MSNFSDKFQQYKDRLRLLPDNQEKVDILNTYAWESRRHDTKYAFHLAQQAQSLAKELWYQRGYADSLKIIGTCNWYFADYLTSLEKCLEALKIYQTLEYKKGESDTTNTLSYVYASLGDYENALKYSKQTLLIRQELDDRQGEATALLTIGVNYLRMGNHQNALKYMIEASNSDELDDETKNFISGYKGEAYYYLNDFESALKHLKAAVSGSEKMNSRNMLSHCSNFIGKILTQNGQVNKAIEYLEKGLKYSIETDSKQEIYEIHHTLSEAYEKAGKIAKAFEHFKLYHVIKEEVFSSENSQKIKALQFQFQTERIQKESEMERLKNVELIKAYDEIAVNQKIISEKNREITDSINYAKKIQQAMLPHRRDIHASLEHSFVFYKPKDIVSGDFYWFSKQGDLILIAVADCTGHGVPGAFTSMICSDKLHDAVKQTVVPGDVLSLVNKEVKLALRQEENKDSTRDGMDIALCAIDRKQKLIHFAGANRPLWYIHEKSKVMEEIKGNKQSIGGFTEEDYSFETHTMAYRDGDSFYIFSDGYADQDGGEEQKKLMTKHLKEKIVEAQHLPLKQQGKFLEHFVLEWMGDNEQRDDMLVIGFKL